MCYRHEPGLCVQQLKILIHSQFACVIHRDDPQLCASRLAEHLPWHNVRMVFHRRDDHFISRLEKRAAPTLGDEVNPLGCTAGENDFAVLSGVDKCRYFLARLFVKPRGELAQLIHAAVNIGVFGFVVSGDGVNHGLRFLRRRAVIKIDQRMAMGGSLKGSENLRGFARRQTRRHLIGSKKQGGSWSHYTPKQTGVLRQRPCALHCVPALPRKLSQLPLAFSRQMPSVTTC